MLLNYYKVLNISNTASKDEIKTAYRKLVKFWHPDKNPSPQAHEKIVEVNEAYEILFDDKKRQVYNRLYEEAFVESISANKRDPANYQEQSKNSKRKTEYEPSSKNSDNYEVLQGWIIEAKKTANIIVKEGLKNINGALETGFYAVGEIGNLFTNLSVLIIIGVIGFYSIQYLFELISGTTYFSILYLILSIIGIILCILAVLGWVTGNLNND